MITYHHGGRIGDLVYALWTMKALGGGVRRCFNPEHLFQGTHQDNMDDMWAKGRNHDQRHPRKLTEASVRQIRVIYATGRETTRSLAAKLNLGKSTIAAVINRKIWAHVGD